MKRNKPPDTLSLEMSAAMARVRAQAICDVIEKHPGVTIGDLAQTAEVAETPIRDILEAMLDSRRGSAAGHVPTQRPSTVPASPPRTTAEGLQDIRLKSGTARNSLAITEQILKVLEACPQGLTANEILAGLDRPPVKINYHLRNLMRAGEITKTGESRTTVYYPGKAEGRRSDESDRPSPRTRKNRGLTAKEIAGS